MTKMNRRNALGRIGWAGAAILAGSSCDGGSPTSPDEESSTTTTIASSSGTSAQCVLTPSLTEGPFYFDASQLRSDITEGRPGVPLRLALTVESAGSCSPIRDAVADIWHCDALGLYSGYQSEGTLGQDFLRGIQVTDANGRVEFQTLYPGWYSGRTIHVHMKIHLDARTVLTSQLYFPEEISDAVLSTSPYNQKGTRNTRNGSDGLFTASTLLDVVAEGTGYSASIVIGVAS
jgi:protocatechuate 3,4-dioxygenase beta subunit